MNKSVVLKGIMLVAVGIMLGALGAHYLENILTPDQLDSFKTGVDYQILGGIILLIFGFNNTSLPNKSLRFLNLFFIGTCLFSVSIYCLTLFKGIPLIYIMGPVTPLGGILMILSLLLVAFTITSSMVTKDTD